ncbi:MAG: PilZ domain-containing protein [Reinekea sp.]|jgi:hypothetical protein
MTTEKRRFHRIPFEQPIQLINMNDPDTCYLGQLRDISLKGALISLESDQHSLTPGDNTLQLAIGPFQGDFEIRLNVEVAYLKDSYTTLGLNLISVDIESAAHLRRLVEVNLGDEQLLQRELSNLIQAMEDEHTL